MNPDKQISEQGIVGPPSRTLVLIALIINSGFLFDIPTAESRANFSNKIISTKVVHHRWGHFRTWQAVTAFDCSTSIL